MWQLPEGKGFTSISGLHGVWVNLHVEGAGILLLSRNGGSGESEESNRSPHFDASDKWV